MLVGICEYQLFLPNAHSLKEKRAVLKSLQARLHNKFPAAVCEAEQQELWQRSTLGVAVLSNQQRHLESWPALLPLWRILARSWSCWNLSRRYYKLALSKLKKNLGIGK